MNDMSLIVEFVQEAREYIDEVEPTLIEIYNGSDELGAIDAELINSVFRLFHSMKGSAGFLALDTIAGVTHEAETLLDKIRNGKLNLTVEITATLCKALDLFREMLDKIAETGEDTGFESPAGVLIEKLKAHSEGKIPDGLQTSDSNLQEGVSTTIPEVRSPESEASSESFPADEPELESRNIQLSPEMRFGFVQEGNEQIDGVEQSLLKVLEDRLNADEYLKEAFRNIHSFKGNCGFMGFVDLERLSHAMETFLDMLRMGVVPSENENISRLLSLLDVLHEGVTSVESGNSGNLPGCEAHVKTLNDIMMIDHEDEGSKPQNETAVPSGQPQNDTPAVSDRPETATSKPDVSASPGNVQTAGKAAAKTPSKQDIRVDLHKLDSLIDLVGELVIAESMVTRCPAVAHVENEYYNRAKHQLRRICDDLKDVAMSVRMIPLSATFRKMVRLVHDLATKSGKKIKLNIVGEETEVDKTVIEQIADPLVHIVRNSCDHGIEKPEERIAGGKPDTGIVTLEGRHEGGEVWILIRDDGHGLNRERILAKALEKGIVGQEAREWPDERIYRLVFEAGFSTAEKITDISGRGVGMDVVRKNIEKLNGRIDIQSVEGKGSTFILRIPLTLAIIDAMLVRVGTAKYMIPTLSILESLVPVSKQVTVTPDGKEILRLRDEMIPIIRLYDIFNQQGDSERLKDGILVVAEESGQSFAIFVDEIVGQQQAVIKGLPDYIGRAEGFSGCTILGDGTVSLIIDIGTLSQMRGTFAASTCHKEMYWDDAYQHHGEEKIGPPNFLSTPETLDNLSPEDVSWEMLEASVGMVACD
ncbi:MAG: chemotaxis protein CheA [Planctomycetaceae bacterium]|nr:chemotaxis protein CheA [Planctomycetaceae bacterium]